MNLFSGPRFSVRCPYQRGSVLERVRIIEVFFIENIYMSILPGPRELSVIERCPYQRGSTVYCKILIKIPGLIFVLKDFLVGLLSIYIRRNQTRVKMTNGTEFSGCSDFPERQDNLARYTQISETFFPENNFRSIRFLARNFRNFWSNGKRPIFPSVLFCYSKKLLALKH